jgi:Tat protein translocase TatB subunit
VFNFSGSEVIFLLILGLVILGPEKLPGVLRKAGRLYGEFKRVTSDAQSELRQALDQPIREIQSTAKSYQGFFVDAAKEVTKEPNAVPSIEPNFVEYQPPPGLEEPVEDTAPRPTDENGSPAQS